VRMLLGVLGPRRMLLGLMVLSVAQAEIIDFGNDWDSRQVPTFAKPSFAEAARVTADLPDDLLLAYPGGAIPERCLPWGGILAVAFAAMFLMARSCAKSQSVARDEGAALRDTAPLEAEPHEAAPHEAAQHEAVPHETAQHDAVPLVSPPRQQRTCLPQRSKTAPPRLNAPDEQFTSRPAENAADMPEPKILFLQGTAEAHRKAAAQPEPREEMPSGDEMEEQDATQPYDAFCWGSSASETSPPADGSGDEGGTADSDDGMACEDAERLLRAALGGGAKASTAEHTSAQGTANATQTKGRSAPSDAANQVRAAAFGCIGEVGGGLNDSRRQGCGRAAVHSCLPLGQQEKKQRGQQAAMDIGEDAAGPVDENSPRARENKREDAGASEDEAESTASSTSLSSSATSSSRPRDPAFRACSLVSDEEDQGTRGLGKRKREKPDRYASSRRNVGRDE
jgi:hypothetical protein